MYKSYIPYLQHILDECLYIRSVITDDMVIDQFLVDETLKRAVTRSLSTVNSQLSTLNCQLSTITYQLSTVNCQLNNVRAKVLGKLYGRTCKYAVHK